MTADEDVESDDEDVDPVDEDVESDDEQDGPDDGEPIPLPIGDVLDLHSFRPSEVPNLVRDWLDEVVAAGFSRVRIIHGKGRGVQRDTVRTLLGRDRRVVAWGDLPAEHGGWGATWIALAGRPDADTSAPTPNRAADAHPTGGGGQDPP